MSSDDPTAPDQSDPPEDESREDQSREDEAGSPETEAEKRFRRRVGVSLATLAMLGAWIAVLATNAGTNESAAARQATRLAAEAQTADVLAKGVDGGLDQIETEIELLPTRPPFQAAGGFVEALGGTTDPVLDQQRLADAQAALESALGSQTERPEELQVEALRLSLEQAVVVEQRVEWNAYASQYETVLTVLAVAVFLVGFTLVLGRKLRPPVAVPGIILAIVCFGWAMQIYTKPKTVVSDKAITETAEGDYALSDGRPGDADADFTAALEATPDYFEALAGRSLATLVRANPDLLNTVAFTDSSEEVTEAAKRDIDAAMDAGGDTDASVLAVASVVALAENDWDLAAEHLEQGIELNALAAELYLWRSAVAVAQGDEDAAGSWLTDAVDRFGDVDDQQSRNLAAQYLSLLAFVADREPDRAELADQFTKLGVVSISENAAGRSLEAGTAPDATITAASAVYDDGATTVTIDLAGTPADSSISLVGYEMPADGAAWVQPSELFYTGPPEQGEGVTIKTPRSCVAVEYRFDLYVEGELRNSTNIPGAAAATC